MTLYIEQTGTQGAPSILFLHGAGTSGWMWQAQTHDLSDFHCLNVDLPGHGKSNHIGWISLADTADQIAAIITAHATGGRAHVVGLSLGAYVALHLINRHSACIHRAVLTGVTAAPLPNGRMMKLQMWGMSYLMRNRWFVRKQAKMMQMPDDAVAAYADSMLAMSRAAFVQIYKEAVNFRLPDHLGAVQTPVLITAGGSEMLAILQAVEAIAKMMPNAVGALAPGLHHGWNGEDPELFSTMLRAWFTGGALPDGLQLLQPAQVVEVVVEAI